MKQERLFGLIIALVLLCGQAAAQWRAETYNLQPGWNAIYTFIDASHAPIEQVVPPSSNVTEIWRWQPDRTDDRQLAAPGQPVTGVEWGYWRRDDPSQSSFDKLLPNYGYLVFVSGTTPRNLSITGRAVVPNVQWRNDGLHLVGFPVVEGSNGPTFSSYLSGSGFSLGQSEIFDYFGGPLVNQVNPRTVPASTRIRRNKAYWIKVAGFSRFHGPVRVELSSGDGIDYGTNGHTYRMVLTNLTGTAQTVDISSMASAAPPAGQPPVAGPLSFLAKIDGETAATPLASGRTVTIPANGHSMVQLVLNRAVLAGAKGDVSGALVRVSVRVSGQLTQDVFLPATAVKSSLAGLWVGEAEISGVSSAVIRYRRDPAGNTLRDSNGDPIVEEDLTTPGASSTLPGTADPYSLKLIVHVTEGGQATMISHIYSGRLSGAPASMPYGLTRVESALDPAHLGEATRLSVSHLPLDSTIPLGGPFTPGASLASSGLVLAHNAPDNPFVHSYHPDHDNRGPRFDQVLPPGRESFTVTRTFTLAVDTAPPEGVPGSWGNTLLTGTYGELVSGIYKEPIRVKGVFALRKVSDISTLHVP